MEMETVTSGDTLIIKVCEPRIDAAIALKFKEMMRQASAQAEKRILLDLTDVDFVDSSGLGAIVASSKQASDHAFELAGLTETVAKVFRLTRLDSVFVIHDTPQRAFDPVQS